MYQLRIKAGGVGFTNPSSSSLPSTLNNSSTGRVYSISSSLPDPHSLLLSLAANPHLTSDHEKELNHHVLPFPLPIPVPSSAHKPAAEQVQVQAQAAEQLNKQPKKAIKKKRAADQKQQQQQQDQHHNTVAQETREEKEQENNTSIQDSNTLANTQQQAETRKDKNSVKHKDAKVSLHPDLIVSLSVSSLSQLLCNAVSAVIPPVVRDTLTASNATLSSKQRKELENALIQQYAQTQTGIIQQTLYRDKQIQQQIQEHAKRIDPTAAG